MNTLVLMIFLGAGLLVGIILLIFLVIACLLALSAVWGLTRRLPGLIDRMRSRNSGRDIGSSPKTIRPKPSGQTTRSDRERWTPEELAIDLLRAALYA